MSADADILVECKDGVGWVTMNRPERLNALTLGMWDALVAAFRDLTADTAVGAIVLTGAGRGFCAGRDQDEAAEMADEQPLTRERLLEMHRALIPMMVQAPKPVIAAVNGPAAGAGLSLALACDLRVAAREARLTVSFLQRGLTPDAGMSYLLQRAIGYSRALELCLGGALLDAEESLRIGLVDRVVDAIELVEVVQATAEAYAALPPRVVRATKELLLEGSSPVLDRVLEQEAIWQSQIVADASYREGIRSFLEARERRRGAG